MTFDLVTRYHGGYEDNYGDREFYLENGFHLKSFLIEANGEVIGEISTNEYEELVFDGMPPIEDGLSRTDEQIVTDTLVNLGFVSGGMTWSGMIY